MKIEEEADRIFLVRFVRLALISVILIALVVLPGVAAWRALDPFFAPLSRTMFLNNLGWLLLYELYNVGLFCLLFSLTYLFGGSKALKLCGLEIDEWTSGEDKASFGCLVLCPILVYLMFVGLGNVVADVYSWIK